MSAQLDNELPDSELDRLEAHLLVCPECSAWAEQVGELTSRLRATRLEQPVERLVLHGRRSRGWRVGSAVAVASAAAVAATLFYSPGQHSSATLGVPQVSGFVGVTGQNFVVSRMVRLEDGVYAPVSMSQQGFRHF